MAEEPPYGVIWDQIDAGQVIPFIGAGASLCGRPNDSAGNPMEWTGAEAAFLPNGVELGHWLAEKCCFPDSEDDADLAKIASYFEIRARRHILKSRLRDVFSKEYDCGAIHEFLADSPKPQLIVTTNYDNLIEKAFQAKERDFHLVTHPERDESFAGSVLWWKPHAVEPVAFTPATLPLSLTDTTIIYKMHGTVSHYAAWNSFVITEEDYVRFLARMTQRQAIPARFTMQFMSSSFLFLGYGLRDWNLRVMLENLRNGGGQSVSERQLSGLQIDAGGDDVLGEILSQIDRDASDLPSWAIQHEPSELERTLWAHRKIQIFDVSLNNFVDRMRAWRRRASYVVPDIPLIPPLRTPDQVVRNQ
jgi:hypothetical protein